MSSSNLFGWELLRQSVANSISKEADHIVAFVHWFLLQRAHLECLGNGNDLKLLPNDAGSELLPVDWNLSPITYALRYQLQDSVYVLLGTISGETIVLNLLSANQMELSNAQFHIATTAETIRSGNRRTIGTDLQAIIDRLTAEMLNPVFENNQKTAETQTTSTASEPSRNDPDQQQRYPPASQSLQNILRRGDPLAVGRGDLDPLGGYGGGGGGMLFQPPMRPGVMPPDLPGHMPGARYDPFGPLGPPNNPRRSRHDHFRPPGFDDDYYM